MNIGEKIVAAIICLVLVLMAYGLGVNNANESACESAGGVYVVKTCLDVEVIILSEG